MEILHKQVMLKHEENTEINDKSVILTTNEIN